MEKKKAIIGCTELDEYFKKNSVGLYGCDSTSIYFRSEYRNEYRWDGVSLNDEKKARFDIVSFDEYFEKKPETKGSLKDVLNIQVGGNHYKDTKIQPIEYIMANNLNFPEGCVVKYISRHRNKNKEQDLLKAMQNIQMILADEYGVVVEFKIKE